MAAVDPRGALMHSATGHVRHTWEVRWFGPGRLPREIADTLSSARAADRRVRATDRRDSYQVATLRAEQSIKLRDGRRIERKQRHRTVSSTIVRDDERVAVELWSKTQLSVVPSGRGPRAQRLHDQWWHVDKQLLHGVLEGPGVGARWEVGHLSTGHGEQWWTFAIDARTEDSVGAPPDLARALTPLWTRSLVVASRCGQAGSYPVWLLRDLHHVDDLVA
jgi:hypothetical protein